MVSSCQDRVSMDRVTMGKMSEKITEATGWFLNDDGQWVQNRNILSGSEKPPMSSTDQSFDWLQSAFIYYQGKKYYVVFFQSQSGEFKYPETMQDWEMYNTLSFWILDEIQYASLKKAVESKSGGTMKISNGIVLTVNKGDYDKDIFLSQLGKCLRDKSRYRSGSCLFLNSQILKGQNIVRFRLPEDCAGLEYFGKRYFEVKSSEFKKLLID